MITRVRAGAAGVGRLRRRLGFDRNPLRRPVDRVQWTVGLVLLGLFLVVAPLVAGRTATRTYDAGVRTERVQGASRYHAVARVTDVRVKQDGGRNSSKYAVLRWDAPDGTIRTAETWAWFGAAPGDRRGIWADTDGRLTGRPQKHAETIANASLAGIVATGAAGLPFLAAYLLVRQSCDRRRRIQWETELARLGRHRII
ncbi:hypothetical protein [Actinomadura rayongensis]|uniref:Uncharacterized protein n=1 Tax=Actinomadura rayongensis TaxID=1429076 RepID=A0A6I4WB59_9ACTN|nr:hypothetical protein [Actinomadura rayongensis]MXQ65266.1 hypothetical protein [Actinomadura rayongensis]